MAFPAAAAVALAAAAAVAFSAVPLRGSVPLAARWPWCGGGTSLHEEEGRRQGMPVRCEGTEAGQYSQMCVASWVRAKTRITARAGYVVLRVSKPSTANASTCPTSNPRMLLLLVMAHKNARPRQQQVCSVHSKQTLTCRSSGRRRAGP